ncbi:MFS transporter [Actinoalloteichus sp. AHMU CJ021]|uniref:MFS transporter n=1 Tax=Actinoalloteichus sp. AHMU CJ021 TaxID=2072503 RepID=UPI002689B094
MDGTGTRGLGRREWAALAVLSLPTLVLAMDITVLHLAVPALSADLDPTGTQLLWILDVYGFVVAGFLLVMGALGDRIGRRRLLMVGAAAFAVVSVLAAFSSSAELLIAARALLGVAGATLMPSTLAVLTDVFRTPARRTFAVAVWMTAFTSGEAVGPLVGGLVLEFLWWGAVFLVGVPVMVLLLVVGPFVLPESAERLPGRFDLASATALLASVLSFVYGVKELASRGGWEPLGWIAAGLVLGCLFGWRQLRTRDPLLDLRLFRRAPFSAGFVAQLLAVAAMAGSQLLVMQYLQSVLGLSPFEAGLWTLPSVLLGIGATLLAPRLVRHSSAAPVVATGLFAAAVGATALAVTSHHLDLGSTVLGFTVLYVGVTPTLALMTDLIVGSAPRGRAGMAAGVAESGAEFGLAGGMAFIGTVASATYSSRVLSDASGGVAVEHLQEASRTVGNAVALAQDLPPEVGTSLLDAARMAFADGMRLAATVSAVLLVVGGALALRFLRPARSTTPGDHAAGARAE